MMDADSPRLISIGARPASDSWGFVGVISVGDHEAYRTLRAHSTPRDAVAETERLLGDVLGALLAEQEWRTAESEFGHAPKRTELGLGLRPAPDGASTPDEHRPSTEVPSARRESENRDGE